MRAFMVMKIWRKQIGKDEKVKEKKKKNLLSGVVIEIRFKVSLSISNELYFNLKLLKLGLKSFLTFCFKHSVLKNLRIFCYLESDLWFIYSREFLINYFVLVSNISWQTSINFEDSVEIAFVLQFDNNQILLFKFQNINENWFLTRVTSFQSRHFSRRSTVHLKRTFED